MNSPCQETRWTAQSTPDSEACSQTTAARISDGSVEFQREEITALPPALQRRLLRRAVAELRGSLKDIEWRHAEEMLALLEKPAGKRIDLPGGLMLVMDYATLRLSRTEAAVPYPALPDATRLEVPGVTRAGGWKISAELTAPGKITDSDVYAAHFDADRTGKDLWPRARRRGDRFQPLGMQGTKKVSRFLIDARVPAAWRERIPIVTDGEEIIWLVGQRIDAHYRVTHETRRVLRLEFRPDPDPDPDD